ncbi:MAG: hypothetical protein OXU64_03490 [Gemmatimonadota bacterium]|nr:hypothetical protein [Gemmatimonadota bacterium]
MSLWKRRGKPVENRQGVTWEEWNRLYEGAPVRDILDDDTTHAVSPAGDVMKVSDTAPPELVHMGGIPGTLEQAVDGLVGPPEDC